MNEPAEAGQRPPPKVTVLIITFNHRAHIAHAIDSALMQKTRFDFEIVVGDDCSTDGTREIVAEYQRKHPDKVRALLHEKNLGQLGKINFIQSQAISRGQYVALLEGDDYWISPDKLQMQADYLDSHPQCCTCYHNAWIETDGPKPERYIFYPNGQKEMSEFVDFLRDKLPATASVMYRRGLFSEFPEWFFQLKMGDLSFHAINSQFGSFGYLNEIMSVYRVHSGGGWTTKGLVERTMEEIKAFQLIGDFFKGRHREDFESVINQRYFFMAIGYDDAGDSANARIYLKKYLAGHRQYPTIPLRLISRLTTKIYFPFVFKAAKWARDKLRPGASK